MSLHRTGTKRRLVGSAAIACEACRKQKMRCVGAENPPCVRCAKVNRQCIVSSGYLGQKQSRTQLNTVPAHSSQNGGDSQAGISNPNAEVDDQLQLHLALGSDGHESTTGIERSKPFNLPSVYMTSPLGTIDAQLPPDSALNHASDAPTGLLGAEHHCLRTSSDAALSLSELLHLVEFFKAKILVNVLFMASGDLEDLDDFVGTNPELATCMAYVTVLFVPGYEKVRKLLTPEVLKIVRRNYYVARVSDNEMWRILQALSVLYLYASPLDSQSTEDSSPYPAELSYRCLKPVVESLALHASIHRSCEEISKTAIADWVDAGSSVEIRRYLFWLWLFTASQQYALITRTPPTISEDTTIRSAPILLQSIQEDMFVRRILSQVDLYLLWGQAGLRHPNLREWWSLPQTETDLASTKDILDDFTETLKHWRQKWSIIDSHARQEMTQIRHNNTTTEFIFRYTRFHISTYATRALYKAMSESAQKVGPSTRLVPLTSPLAELFSESVNAAASCCRFFLDLDPMAIETARYVPAITFTKLAFSSVFVIMASEVLADPLFNFEIHLRSIKEMAICARELAVDCAAAPRVYADRILQRLQSIPPGRIAGVSRRVPPNEASMEGTAWAPHEETSAGTPDLTSFRPPSSAYEAHYHTSPLAPRSLPHLTFDPPDFDVMISNDDEDIFGFDNSWVF